jgi:hypothetical protein
MTRKHVLTTLGAALVLTAGLGWSQQGGQGCPGCGKGGPGGGMACDDSHREDMALFHFLLDHRGEIRRAVEELPDGVETLTESDAPETVAKLREHVRSMYRRIEEGRPIHRRDPLFAEIFANADKIEMTIEDTERGLRVRETSSDPYVAKLIQSHAQVVSRFLENGYAEMRKNHPLPERK